MTPTSTLTNDIKLDDDMDTSTIPTEQEEFSLEETNFNLEDEFKDEVLAAQGTYNGIIKLVSFNKKLNAIQWDIVAANNPGITLLDGETPVDGVDFTFFNWLPKPGDEKIRSKNGKSNKRQNKINMLKAFQDDMEIDMNTSAAVVQAIEDGKWIGLCVLFKVSISTYNNKNKNQVDTMKRSEETFDMPEGCAHF